MSTGESRTHRSKMFSVTVVYPSASLFLNSLTTFANGPFQFRRSLLDFAHDIAKRRSYTIFCFLGAFLAARSWSARMAQRTTAPNTMWRIASVRRALASAVLSAVRRSVPPNMPR